MNKENFLILDEPTNHLDIDNKEVLENALIDYDGTLLFVSHDRYFINRIATKVVELSENGSKVYLGDYDYYLEKKQEEEEIAELLAQDEPESAPAPTNNEWIDQLEQEMVAPENLEDHVKLNELNQDLEAARQDQETKLTEWEELSLELEEYEN